MNQVITGTAITAPWPTDLKVVFGKPDGAAAIIARVRSEALEQVKGLTTATKRDRDAIASAAYDVAKRKTAFDNAGKSLNDELRVSINAVDAERRTIRESLDALKEEVRKPLTEWEAAEEQRVLALNARLARLTPANLPTDVHQLQEWVKASDLIKIDDTWAEFIAQAAKAKDALQDRLRTALAEAEKREADAAELERLRAAEADRLAREQAEREAAEAEARRVAAEKAEIDRLARIEQEAQEREARAAADAQAKAQADAARAAQEAADREAAQVKAAQDAEARHARELADAKAREEQAAQRERDRLAAERKAEADAQAKREVNKRLRAKVRREIADALTELVPLDPEHILIVADLLMGGKVPHVTVNF